MLNKNEIIEEITFEHMPYLVYPLCNYANDSYYLMINEYKKDNKGIKVVTKNI